MSRKRDSGAIAAALAAMAFGALPPHMRRRAVSPELAGKPSRIDEERAKLRKVDKRRPDGLTSEQARHLKRMGKLP